MYTTFCYTLLCAILQIQFHYSNMKYPVTSLLSIIKNRFPLQQQLLEMKGHIEVFISKST